MRYEVTTGLEPRDALESAVTYFGPKGVGLQLMSMNNLGVVMRGGGGHVAIAARTGPGAKTVLDIETREWDHAVQQFMAQVSRLPRWWSRWWPRKKPASPRPSSFKILD
jgi:hypothetical protein